MLFNNCGPNDAFVKTGLFVSSTKPEIYLNGIALKLPFVQKIQRLDLNLMTVEVDNTVMTRYGVVLFIQGTCQFKIQKSEESVLVI